MILLGFLMIIIGIYVVVSGKISLSITRKARARVVGVFLLLPLLSLISLMFWDPHWAAPMDPRVGYFWDAIVEISYHAQYLVIIGLLGALLSATVFSRKEDSG
jgi:hypothetical protein